MHFSDGGAVMMASLRPAPIGSRGVLTSRVNCMSGKAGRAAIAALISAEAMYYGIEKEWF